jgi:hypothetical protein
VERIPLVNCQLEHVPTYELSVRYAGLVNEFIAVEEIVYVQAADNEALQKKIYALQKKVWNILGGNKSVTVNHRRIQ